MKKLTMTSKCTSIAAHFEGLADVLVQYKAHHADGTCPGLPQKPLDVAIRQLLAPYCPSRCQGNSKQNNNNTMHPLC
jgi:hypothetical protein